MIRVPRKNTSLELTEERWLELIELLLKTRKVLHWEEYRSSSLGSAAVVEEESVEEREGRIAGSRDRRQPRLTFPEH